ncbi:MAG: type II secretion system F family protein [Candidatus Aenigmatarchaeota archaeon]
MNRKILILLNLVFVLGLVFVNLFYLSKITVFSTTIYIIAFFMLIGPIVFTKYIENRRIKELEEEFPVFLRDFVETVRGGMSIPEAFRSISNNDYQKLNPYIKKIAAQIEWGIPLETVLLKFARESKSKLIGRVVSIVIEGHKFGGNLAESFESLSSTAFEIDKLRAERKLYLHSQIITGYIIFFVFLIVIIGLDKFLIPNLSKVSIGAATTVAETDIVEKYKELFRNLILIEGLFAGLCIGKMTEGVIVAGLKHSIIMMVLGFLIFFFLA